MIMTRHRAHWSHVIVDVCAMLVLGSLAVVGVLDARISALLIAAIQGAYVIQFRRGGSPPIGAIAGALGAAAALAGRMWGT